MSNTCLYSLIKGAEDSCEYSKIHCDNQTIFPFTHFYFCQLDENWVILIIVAPILFFLLFNFLARIVDGCLSPAVTFIAEYFNMSQTLAGVTIIAFANGVPDFLCAILASQDNNGILIAVGSIFGSGLFMTTVIVGAVIMISGLIRVEKIPFMRDIIFNGVALILLIAFAYRGEINHYMAIGFCSLYILYILIVLQNERTLKQKQNQNDQSNQQQKKQQKSLEEKIPLSFDDSQIENQKLEKIDKELKSEVLGLELFEQRFAEKTFVQKLEHIYTATIEFVTKITIPVGSREKYDRNIAAIHQLLCPLIMVALLGSIKQQQKVYDMEFSNIKLWIILEVFGILMFIYHIIFELPMIILSIECVVCSIIWSKQIIQVLIDFVLLIQTITGVSYSYLGMTFLAFGNSTCDLLVNTKLASIGYGVMALTGCYSGIVFNMLCGFGGALVRLTWIENYPGVVSFNLFRDQITNSQTDIIISRMNNSIAYCVIIFSLMNIWMTSKIVREKNYKLTTNLAHYYFIVYLTFFIFITTLAGALSFLIGYLEEELEK